MAIWGSQTGGGAVSDALRKAIYDIDDDNIVDNSEALNGFAGSYYLDRTNHTGTQAATTVDYDNSGSSLTATEVQAAIDELDGTIDNIISGAQVVGNASQLNGQADTYYLDRSNHTGVQAATTVTYDNTGSGLAALDVQDAIDELDTTLDDIVSGAVPAGDATLFNSQAPAFYLDRTNHTGSQAATTITYDNATSGLTAVEIQAAIDEIDGTIDDIISGVQVVGNSTLFAGNAPAYYLDRTNHTGSQPATTVTFDNTTTGFAALDVQAAIDEFFGVFQAHTHVKADITDFNEADYVHTSGNESINGNKTFQDDVTVVGTLTMQGDVTQINTTNVALEDNEIELNVGEAGAGITLGFAGVRIKRGTETDARIGFNEALDKWVYGLDGSEVPVGDMEKSVYDTGDNGQVDNADNSDLLQGNDSAYHLSRANHTGTQAATTVTYDNATSGLTAAEVQAAIDEIAQDYLSKAVYDTNDDGTVDSADLADNALLLNGQTGTYYLARANHTGTQPADTVTYNNSGSTLDSIQVQDAIDELDEMKMEIAVYDADMDGQVEAADFADDADQLDGQDGTFYLNRSNHTGTQVATTVTYDNTTSGLAAGEVQAAIDELETLISSVVAGDMFKAAYDTNDDNKVDAADLADNATNLDSQPGSYYLNRANHIGTQLASTVDFDNTLTGYAATNVQDAINEADIKIEQEITDRTTAITNILNGTTPAGDSDQLEGNGGVFYLNRNNHVGTQDADTIDYDNGASGLAATNVQDAIDELDAAIDADGGGDMTKAVYDTNDDGTVDSADFADNAGQLNGFSSSYHLDRTNHTGSQDATTVDFDNVASGLTAVNVQAAIDELDGRIDTNETAIADIISGAQKVGNADELDGLSLSNVLNRNNHLGVQAATTVTYDNAGSSLSATDAQAAIDELDALVASAAGDMTKAVYDTGDNGIVDNSELLEGQPGSYYLDLANATGTIAATDVTFDDTSAVVITASDVQAAILFLDDEVDKIKNGTQSVGNADQLEGQNGSYYLDADNHAYNNAVSGLVATNTQDAIDELSGLAGANKTNGEPHAAYLGVPDVAADGGFGSNNQYIDADNNPINADTFQVYLNGDRLYTIVGSDPTTLTLEDAMIDLTTGRIWFHDALSVDNSDYILVDYTY